MAPTPLSYAALVSVIITASRQGQVRQVVRGNRHNATQLMIGTARG
jgi:hypothetical protein